ncbi:MAG: DUF3426 domain-containing protein [Xanthomonadales bacterium]|nr:DUF3426 domain-containing protein [Xanthomonadales bacterium]
MALTLRREAGAVSAPPDAGAAPAGSARPAALSRRRARPAGAAAAWLALGALLCSWGSSPSRSTGACCSIRGSRRWLRSACARLGCEPPPRRAPEALNLLARDVRRHPDAEGALLITLTVANRASYPVAVPVVELRLSDLADRPVALRRFRPEEYLGDAEALRRGIAPGAVLPLVDRGRGSGPGRPRLRVRLPLRPAAAALHWFSFPGSTIRARQRVGSVAMSGRHEPAETEATGDASARDRLRDCVRRAAQRYLRAAGEQPPGDLYRLLLDEVEAPLFEAVLSFYGGNQTRAAQALGISRVTFRKKLRQLNGRAR